MSAYKSVTILLRKFTSQRAKGKAWLSTQQYCSSRFYDAIIVGGGMVGSTLACALGMFLYQNSKSCGGRVVRIGKCYYMMCVVYPGVTCVFGNLFVDFFAKHHKAPDVTHLLTHAQHLRIRV